MRDGLVKLAVLAGVGGGVLPACVMVAGHWGQRQPCELDSLVAVCMGGLLC